MSKLRVGVIGLGTFGQGIAKRLLWSGFPDLTVYDVNDQETRVFTNDYGGMPFGSPKMVGRASDIVVTVLPSAAELQAVCFGWEGLAGGLPEGGIVLDVGSSDPLETIRIGAELQAKGRVLVDAPAHGRREDARDGRLSFFIGGEDDAFERCRPILDTLGDTLVRTGSVGSAQGARVLADYLLAARILAAAEAKLLGERLGLQAPALAAAFSSATADQRTDTALATDLGERRFSSGMRLGSVRRRLEVVGSVAAKTNVQPPLLAVLRDAWVKAERKLGFGADQTEILRWLESLPALSESLPPEAAAGQTNAPAHSGAASA